MNYDKEFAYVKKTFVLPKFKIGDIVIYLMEGYDCDYASAIVQSRIVTATSYLTHPSEGEDLIEPSWYFTTEEMEKNEDSELFLAEDQILAKIN